MAVAGIVTTAGSATANSYVTEAEADAYFEHDPQFAALWDAITGGSDERIQRIVSAARAVDRLRWRNNVEKHTPETQALLFPISLQDGSLIHPEDTIPVQVKHAQMELLIFMYHNADATTGQIARLIESASVGRGAVSVTYATASGSTPTQSAVVGGNIETVRALFRPPDTNWLASATSFDVYR